MCGSNLNKCLDLAVRNLQDHLQELNLINVFPVPDNDTGTNLLKTLTAAYKTDSLEEMAEAISQGCRGSSGNILALYTLGFVNSDAGTLSQKCSDAALFAWNTMYDPQEGTILTAMKHIPEDQDLKLFLEHYIDNGLIDLINSPDRLVVLKKYETVDSGILGWLYILDGIYEQLFQVKYLPEISVSVRPVEVNYDYPRYCLELLINKPEESRSPLADELQPLGNELIILKSSDKIKLHLHTDTPKKAINICNGYGQVSDIKIDDMLSEK